MLMTGIAGGWGGPAGGRPWLRSPACAAPDASSAATRRRRPGGSQGIDPDKDPVMIGQRYLNLHRQSKAIGEVGIARVDKMLIDLEDDVLKALEGLAGGMDLLYHIEDLDRAEVEARYEENKDKSLPEPVQPQTRHAAPKQPLPGPSSPAAKSADKQEKPAPKPSAQPQADLDISAVLAFSKVKDGEEAAKEADVKPGKGDDDALSSALNSLAATPKKAKETAETDASKADETIKEELTAADNTAVPGDDDAETKAVPGPESEASAQTEEQAANQPDEQIEGPLEQQNERPAEEQTATIPPVDPSTLNEEEITARFFTVYDALHTFEPDYDHLLAVSDAGEAAFGADWEAFFQSQIDGLDEEAQEATRAAWDSFTTFRQATEVWEDAVALISTPADDLDLETLDSKMEDYTYWLAHFGEDGEGLMAQVQALREQLEARSSG